MKKGKATTSRKAPPRRASSRGRPARADREAIDDLVTANRILFDRGVVDGFGHVSIRHPARNDRFLLARNMAPGLVTRADILEFDLGGDVINSRERVYLERFIHGEIYRVRPDVNAVVHSHSPAVIPYGVASGVQLRPIFHMSGFLGQGCPIFEIRRAAGMNSDLLIRSRELGAALATDLGVHSAILMRGHGATVVADNLRRAVYRAVYMQVNAELQTVASALGPVTFLSPGEAESTVLSVEGQLNRAWDLWEMLARGPREARARGARK